MRFCNSRLLVLAALAACSGTSSKPLDSQSASQSAAPPSTLVSSQQTLVVVGTSDLHGHLEMLPWFGGYVANLRQAYGRENVLLIDAGDMFQGTMESNLNEGEAVVSAYNQLGYSAAAIGNHEFDFGPVGEKSAAGPGDDPRENLKARAKQAAFPLLAANVLENGAPPNWQNIQPFQILTKGTARVGVIGITTESTTRATFFANVIGLSIAPLVQSIRQSAEQLRKEGATVIVVAAHAGGDCKVLGDSHAIASCDASQEIMEVAAALPPALVDVIVAGHTHQAMAHFVNGIAIVQSFAKGVAFGRVDIVLGQKKEVKIHPPQFLCLREQDSKTCTPPAYEGKPVVPDEALLKIWNIYSAKAQAKRDESLNVTVKHELTAKYKEESAVGNWTADVMRQAHPADVALTNGGGLRADLPVGALTYGRLFEVMPFDNHFVTMKISGAELASLFEANLVEEKGILSTSGISVVASCKEGRLTAQLFRVGGSSKNKGKKIKSSDTLTLVISDFLAGGGDGLFADTSPARKSAVLDETQTIRDGIAAMLKKQGGSLSGLDPRIFNPRSPRIQMPGPRPVRCPKQ